MDILDTIKSECPRLRSLDFDMINTHDTDITPEDSNDFFRTRSLESLKTSIGLPLMDKDLFSTFGRMETLSRS